MRKIFSLDPNYNSLKHLNLIGDNFVEIPLAEIQEFIRKICNEERKAKESFNNFFKILNEENKASIHSIKALIFINKTLSHLSYDDNLGLFELLRVEINFLICLENGRLESKEKNRSNLTESSLEKMFKHLKSNPITNKFTKTLNNKSFNTSFHTTNVRKFDTEEDSEKLPNKRITRCTSDISSVSKEELIIRNIILPYSTYLLKLLSANLEFNVNPVNIEFSENWKIVNLLKSLFRVSEEFSKILRYFGKECYNLVLVMILVLHQNVIVLEPTLKNSLKLKAELIQKTRKSFSPNKEKNIDEKQRKEKTMESNEANEIRQLLEEIGLIENSIMLLYRGKYTAEAVKKQNIEAPPTFSDDPVFNVIYDILKETEKEKRVTSKPNQKDLLSFLNTSSSSAASSSSNKKYNISNKSMQIFKPFIDSEEETSIEENMRVVRKTEKPIISSFRRIRMNISQQAHPK